MKRIKIMLLSFAILAIVGGALAFKATNLQPYCTAEPLEEPHNFCKIQGAGTNIACPNRVLLTTLSPQTDFYCYTIPVAGREDCKQFNNGPDVICTSTTTSFKDIEP